MYQMKCRNSDGTDLLPLWASTRHSLVISLAGEMARGHRVSFIKYGGRSLPENELVSLLVEARCHNVEMRAHQTAIHFHE